MAMVVTLALGQIVAVLVLVALALVAAGVRHRRWTTAERGATKTGNERHERHGGPRPVHVSPPRYLV
jgi:hypothetical protein